ncbi:MAG: hypothetical protein KF780_04380 [Sphingomonas sp.]|nr:hypothetical protein [Sphingomonas sp.]
MRLSFWLPVVIAAIAVPPLMAQEAGQSDAPSPAGLSDLADTLRDLDDAVPQEAEPEPDTEATPAVPPAEAEAASAALQTPSEPPPPLTREQATQLVAAVRRGQQLAAIARAGIIATQDMLSRVSDPEGAGIAGWIAEPEGNATQVIFYAHGGEGGDPVAVYRANIMGPRVVSREIFTGADRPALNPIEARMARARDATDALDHQTCGGQAFNVFVIPPESASAPVDVYQISPATRRGHFPLGGHFRSTIAADGTVSDERGFTNSCVDLEAPPVPEGQQPRPIAFTHLLDPLPTEVHVFLSQWIGRPLLVVAGEPQRIFLVTGDRIAEVRDAPSGR